MRVRVRARACARVCVSVCLLVRACVRAILHVCTWVRACVRSMHAGGCACIRREAISDSDITYAAGDSLLKGWSVHIYSVHTSSDRTSPGIRTNCSPLVNPSLSSGSNSRGNCFFSLALLH